MLAIGLGFALAAGVLSLVAAPLVSERYQSLKSHARDSADLSKIVAERFMQFGRDDPVFYVERISGGDQEMEQVFMHASAGEADEVILAPNARYISGEDGRFVILEEGQRYVGTPGGGEWSATRFTRYTVRIREAEVRTPADRVDTLPSLRLWAAGVGDRSAAAELQWRASQPLLTFLLAAVAFALSGKGRGRFDRLATGALFYLAYLGLVIGATQAIEAGDLPPEVGVWPVHAGFAVLAAVLLGRALRAPRRRYRRRRRGGSPGEAPAGRPDQPREGPGAMSRAGSRSGSRTGTGAAAGMILDRYIARNVLAGVFIVLVGLVSLFFIGDLIVDLDNVGRGGFDYTAALAFVLMRMPGRMYALLPAAALIGCLLGLGQLARGSELTAMRAAGVPVSHLVGAAMKAGVLVIAAGLAVGEWLAPPSERLAHEWREAAISGRVVSVSGGGFWARDGRRFLHFGRVLPSGELRNLRMFEFNEAGRLESAWRAGRATPLAVPAPPTAAPPRRTAAPSAPAPAAAAASATAPAAANGKGTGAWRRSR